MSDQSELDNTIIKMVQNLPREKKEDLIEILEGWHNFDDDQRLSSRKQFDLPIDFSVDNKFYSETLKNLSPGGAFIMTPMHFETGNTAAMIISLPGLDRNIKITGIIIRQSKEGIGIKFTSDLEQWSNILKNGIDSDSDDLEVTL